MAKVFIDDDNVATEVEAAFKREVQAKGFVLTDYEGLLHADTNTPREAREFAIDFGQRHGVVMGTTVVHNG